MAHSIVFISRNQVKPGRHEDVRAFFAAGAPMLEASKPRTLAFLPFLDAESGELAIVHVFGDAGAFADHLEGVADRSGSAYELIEPRGFELYGPAGDAIAAGLRHEAHRAGVPLRVAPDDLTGFLRLGE